MSTTVVLTFLLAVAPWQFAAADAQLTDLAAKLPVLTAGDIVDRFSDQCLALLSAEKCLPHPEHCEHIFLAAELVSKHSSDVLFAFAPIGELLRGSSTFRVKLNKASKEDFTSQHAELLLIQRELKDRSCLLKPSHLRKELSGVLFSTPKNIDAVLQTLNEVCGTYFSPMGLTPAGLHRQQILEDLPNFATHGPTMHELVQQCSLDGTLKEFFYTGHCDSSFCLKDDQCPSNELPTCASIDYIPDSETFFANYLSHSRPVIFRGVAKSFYAPLFRQWSNAFFRERFGTNLTHIKLTPEGEFEGVEPLELWKKAKGRRPPSEVLNALSVDDFVVVRPAGVEMPFGEFLDLVEGTRERNLSAYLEYTSVKEMKGLEQSVDELPCVRGILKLEMLNIWLSNGNTLGKLHFDQFDNFLVQLSGRKQLILFDPFDNRRLYEGHILEAMLSYSPVTGEFSRTTLMENTAMTMSPFDIVRPNFQKFPFASSLRPLNCTINEGDILFMPSFWWHEVQSYPSQKERRNLAINFWYEPFLNKEFPCHICPLDVNARYRDLL